jgi:5-(carboxyamino)imidazole ribonucleotide mutase
LRINVIFGSKSDNKVYEPLIADLKKIDGVKVFSDVCSAHREPHRLSQLIKDNPCDLFIAGAGLAAHLPGVVASQTETPVIGVPCDDILQGYDALLSTLQMPKGVPVLAAGVNKTDSVVNFVRWYAQNSKSPPIFRVHAPKWAANLVEKITSPLEEIGWDFVSHTPDVDHPPGIFSLVLADLFIPPPSTDSESGAAEMLPGSKQGIWLGLPVFASAVYDGDIKQLGGITSQGGLWVGINNTTNLLITLLQLWPIGSKEQDLLRMLRHGEKQSVR